MTSHNIIANLGKRGYNTKVIGVVGNDDAGYIAIKSLEDLDVDVADIEKADVNTRCFHVSYFDDDRKLKFPSKKRCPKYKGKKWYNDSKLKPNDVIKIIEKKI